MSLKSIISPIFWSGLYYTGLSWFMREVVLRKRVTILLYHNPEPGDFQAHMAWLSSRYQFIPLQQLIDAIAQKDWQRIPAKALIVTLDDGHQSNYLLRDSIKQFQIPATIFACSHIVNTHRRYWWQVGYPDNQTLKTLPRADMLQQLKQKTAYEPEKAYPERCALSLEEIKALQAVGVDFQGHGKFHPILPLCEDAESHDEIVDGKKALEALVDNSVTFFAYPNGDYGEREINYLKQAAYRGARTTKLGWAQIDSDPFQLPSISVHESASVKKLSAQITGLHHYLFWFL
ncbi:polysaccharide deacetylase family protein [Candidatus Venteria ishoeyi]|uniref:Polysaccharide deacetylase n=1 Tax=Candidatus Venteria ishoeyi TaxID=1899563 RepID=A0A1H6FEI0_9GAMM|nr:polysaccharide deacetylase family protein [Candidatus Venteria ishoeyi]SEH08490.1 Polysaccharide deacetylase [Candidatus Venteria ishoeyi]